MLIRRDFLRYAMLGLMTSAIPLKAKGWYLGGHGEYFFKNMIKNVYIMHGINGQKDDEAKCFIHNPAFIESKNGIILIDPGASDYVGKEVLKQIEEITDKPIIAIFNTHHHSDHWFANGAIVDKYPSVKIYGHQNIIASSKEQYLRDGRLEKNRCKVKNFTLPNYFVNDGDRVELDGEHFYIQHPKSAHTNSDIIITHEESNVIFLGDTALESTLGYFSDHSSILGNIHFLEKLSKQKRYALYVPGHGKSGTLEHTVEPYLYYLNTIKKEVTKAYYQGYDIFDLKPIKSRIENHFAWQENFNFSLNFLENHMEFVYMELEKNENNF